MTNFGDLLTIVFLIIFVAAFVFLILALISFFKLNKENHSAIKNIEKKLDNVIKQKESK